MIQKLNLGLNQKIYAIKAGMNFAISLNDKELLKQVNPKSL